jgi:hypothetical protein
VPRISHRREPSGPPRCVTRCGGGPSLTRYILAGTPGSDETSILSDRDERWGCTSIEESTTDVITCTRMASAFANSNRCLSAMSVTCHIGMSDSSPAYPGREDVLTSAGAWLLIDCQVPDAMNAARM